MFQDTDAAARKASARQTYRARRAARSLAQLRRAELALREQARRCDATSIAAFVPVRGEPGSIEVLDELARRARVVLPITGRADEPLSWASYAGAASLVRGPHGLLQPPRSDGSTLADVEVVLVPALAIGRDGTRLGQGGGFYDRALADVPRKRIRGVVHEDEVADSVPVEPHDVRVGWVCTPAGTTRLSA